MKEPQLEGAPPLFVWPRLLQAKRPVFGPQQGDPPAVTFAGPQTLQLMERALLVFWRPRRPLKNPLILSFP